MPASHDEVERAFIRENRRLQFQLQFPPAGASRSDITNDLVKAKQARDLLLKSVPRGPAKPSSAPSSATPRPRSNAPAGTTPGQRARTPSSHGTHRTASSQTGAAKPRPNPNRRPRPLKPVTTPTRASPARPGQSQHNKHWHQRVIKTGIVILAAAIIGVTPRLLRSVSGGNARTRSTAQAETAAQPRSTAQPRYVYVPLHVPKNATFQVHTWPPSTLLVRGKTVGEAPSPQWHTAQPGRYKLEFRTQDGTTRSFWVDLREGARHTIKVNLEDGTIRTE
jgi:hypothetical protein